MFFLVVPPMQAAGFIEMQLENESMKGPSRLRSWMGQLLLVASAVIVVGFTMWTVIKWAERNRAIKALKDLGGDFSDNNRGLHLAGPHITDAELLLVEKLKYLTYFSLEFTQVTDAGLIHIASLKKLESLFLENSAITDAGILHLHGLQNLFWLGLKGAPISGAAVESLQSILPNLTIHVGPESRLERENVSADGIYIGMETQDTIKIDSSEEVSAEEVAVLSALLNDIFSEYSSNNQVLLICDETMSVTEVFNSSTSRYTFARDRLTSMPTLRRETLVSWERNIVNRYKIDHFPNLSVPHKVYPALSGTFGEPDPEWEDADQVYLPSGRSIIVSRVGLNPQRTQAFVFFVLPGGGWFILAEKTQGKWKSVSDLNPYVF